MEVNTRSFHQQLKVFLIFCGTQSLSHSEIKTLLLLQYEGITAQTIATMFHHPLHRIIERLLHLKKSDASAVSPQLSADKLVEVLHTVNRFMLTMNAICSITLPPTGIEIIAMEEANSG